MTVYIFTGITSANYSTTTRRYKDDSENNYLLSFGYVETGDIGNTTITTEITFDGTTWVALSLDNTSIAANFGKSFCGMTGIKGVRVTPGTSTVTLSVSEHLMPTQLSRNGA